MDKKGGEKIERMGLIFNEIESRREQNFAEFKKCVEQAGDYGMGYALYYLIVEQDMEEKGLIKSEICKKD